MNKKLKGFLLFALIFIVSSFSVNAMELGGTTTNNIPNYMEAPTNYSDSDWSYHYEMQEHGYEKLIGAYYQGEYYIYEYNEDVIVGMKDNSGNQVVKYTYDGYGLLQKVLSLNNNQWIENDSPDFIGNKNKMLWTGMFYDAGTRCYYVNARYYNPILNKYMDGSTNASVLTDDNPYFHKTNDGIMHMAADESDWAALQWANQLLANSAYGVPISYSSSWYSSLSAVEVVARAIYCEGGTAYTAEDSAVAWVIRNRVVNPGFGSSASEVVKQSGQFSSITGGSGASNEARNPSTGTDRWEHSTYLACLLFTTTSEQEWNTIVGDKLDGQLYFYSYSVAKDKYNNNSSVFTGTTSSTLKYNGSSIKNVYVLGYGNVTSFSTLFNNYSPIAYSRNIYYDYK